MKDENTGICPFIWLVLILSIITVSIILPYFAEIFTSCGKMEVPARSEIFNGLYIGRERDTLKEAEE